MADLVQDARHGLRLMRRSPGFTTVACTTLALGIGANTAIFSLVNVLVWRDLPVRDPGSLVQFTWQYPGDPPLHSFSTQNYEHYRDRNDVFSALIGTAPFRLDAEPGAEPLNTEWVTADFFDALGVRPAIGRLLEPADSAPGAAPVAVVSWSCWNNRFNLDPRVLGTQVAVGGVSAQVIGVTRREFSGLLTGYRTDVWIPAAAARSNSRQAAGFLLMARLKDGVSIERARAQMRVLDRQRIEGLAQKDPQWLKVTLEIEPARTGFSTPLHQQFGKPLLVVMAIVGSLLLLTCANIGSMLLARAAARHRDMAVRVSLGASRSRIVRQLLTESLLLALTGSLFGVVGARLAADVLVRITTSGTRLIGAPPELDVPIDVSVLMFAAGTAVFAAVLFALAPVATAFAPASALRVTGGTAHLRSGRLFGRALVVAQVALSLVLLTVAGLFVQHLSDLRHRNLGFDPTSVLLVSVDAARAGADREGLTQLHRNLLERFEALPGVRSVTSSGMTPISGAAGSRFVAVEGFDEARTARRRVMLNNVAPKYFATFRTPLVAGRDFQIADLRRSRVAIVNEAMARYYFANRNPLGRQLLLEGDTRPYEVVGVVADAKYADVRIPAPATVYLHAFQQDRLPTEFALRTSVQPTMIIPDVRRIVAEVLRDGSVRKVTTLSEQVDASIVPERLIATVSGFFGATGVSLAAIGLYGLLAYTVARRTHEIGIRIALGATRQDVTRMVLRDALSLVCLGLVIGAPVAFWSGRIAASALEASSGARHLPHAMAVIVIVAVALLAAWFPARCATRVEPLTALRSE